MIKFLEGGKSWLQRANTKRAKVITEKLYFSGDYMQYIILDGDVDTYSDDLDELEEQGKIEFIPEELPEDTDDSQVNDIFALVNRDTKEWLKKKGHVD